MSILSSVSTLVFDVVTPLIPLFAAWIIHRIVKVFEDKTKITLPSGTEAMIEQWLEKGIMYAEAKGQQAVKNKLDAVKGPDKMEMAVQFVLDMADRYGLVQLAKDKVEKMVEAKLAIMKKDAATPQG